MRVLPAVTIMSLAAVCGWARASAMVLMGPAGMAGLLQQSEPMGGGGFGQDALDHVGEFGGVVTAVGVGGQARVGGPAGWPSAAQSLRNRLSLPAAMTIGASAVSKMANGVMVAWRPPIGPGVSPLAK